MFRLTAAMILALGLTLWTAEAAAQQIYRWVDAEGVVHFSDTPPEREGTEVSAIELKTMRSSSYDPAEDIYNIDATRQRTEARWERMQELQVARELQPRSPSQPVIQYPERVYYGSGYGYDYGRDYGRDRDDHYPRSPGRPGIGPGRPGHGPGRPPSRPGRPDNDTSTWRPPGRADG